MILLVKMKDQSVFCTNSRPPIFNKKFCFAIHLSTVSFHKKSKAIDLFL
jgi:hypothetical protein